ncbi:TPA: HNH endonuclease [Elizabethkingia anophelis]|nr:HNH endonuclease [Elizabethkingia anophelis]
MKNPKWHRDELILTLNLYYKLDSSLFTKTNPEVIELSKLLNKLPIHSEKERKQDFRNPSGVAMKLNNFVAIDPHNKNKGLDRFSKLDKETFDEFYNKRNELERITNLILSLFDKEEVISKLYHIELETDNFVKEGFEGEIIFKLHKVYERDNKLIESKKKYNLQETGRLECEVCEFDFFKIYGELGKGFIECHHTKPLSTYESKQKTELKDLALVCSNCHRMLHRNVKDMSIENLKNVIKNRLH